MPQAAGAQSPDLAPGPALGPGGVPIQVPGAAELPLCPLVLPGGGTSAKQASVFPCQPRAAPGEAPTPGSHCLSMHASCLISSFPTDNHSVLALVQNNQGGSGGKRADCRSCLQLSYVRDARVASLAAYVQQCRPHADHLICACNCNGYLRDHILAGSAV